MKEIDQTELKKAYDEFIRNLKRHIESSGSDTDDHIEKIENACFNILGDLEDSSE